MKLEPCADLVRSGTHRERANSQLAWRFTMMALALPACGGAAQSEAVRDERAPRGESVSPGAPSPAERLEPEPVDTAPVPMAPEASLSPPALPSRCMGVVGSSGHLAVEVRDQRELEALAGCPTIAG